MEIAEQRPKPKKLQEGDIVYSPYEQPSKTKKDHHWEVAETHTEKGYPFKWRLVKDIEEQKVGPINSPQLAKRMGKRYPTVTGNANARFAEPRGDKD